jgi:Bax protein
MVKQSTVDNTTQSGCAVADAQKTSAVQKLALLAAGGLVVAGVMVAVIAPPASVTKAPHATLTVGDLVAVDAVPLTPVESAELALLKPAANGMSVAEMRQMLAYDLDLIRDGASVPRVFLASIPSGLADVQETKTKKALFYKSVLPLVLQVNDEILNDRARLERLGRDLADGIEPAAVDRLWLAMMSDRYDVKRDDTAAMLQQVDVIPPSLALAQAATESGWGTSRFTREGNALFGQWTWAEGNLVPTDRTDGKEHMIKAFSALIDSVRAYAHNLNTHRAYREYREMRAQLRARDKPMDGRVLAGALHRYSEMGVEYVNAIRAMISHNGLSRFDDARLARDLSEPAA